MGNLLADLVEGRLKDGGARISESKLLMAPGMGGDFQGKSKVIRMGGLLGEYGEYPTDLGKNYYGYAGYMPLQIERLKLGGAVGAYGPDVQRLNGLAGLLATYPIVNGEARLMVSPGKDGPAIFMGYDKRF